MKKLFNMFAVLLAVSALSFGFVSCSDDDDDSKGPGNPAGHTYELSSVKFDNGAQAVTVSEKSATIKSDGITVNVTKKSDGSYTIKSGGQTIPVDDDTALMLDGIFEVFELYDSSLEFKTDNTVVLTYDEDTTESATYTVSGKTGTITLSAENAEDATVTLTATTSDDWATFVFTQDASNTSTGATTVTLTYKLTK